MIRVWASLRPHRLEQVKSALAALGVTGMTVSDARGVGNSSETPVHWAGEAHVVSLPVRARIEVVVPDALRDKVVEAIVQSAHTGESGDGKIFVEPVADAIRVRTEERGDIAL